MNLTTFRLLLTATLALSASASAQATLIYVLTDKNDLLAIDSETPSDIITGGAISGLGGQDLVGIDIRPANGLLYGVGNFGGIYTINPTTFAATQVSNIDTQLFGSRFGVDFDPVADRLRIVSNADQNLRVNVDTGLALIDGALHDPSSPDRNLNVVGAAYANSLPGAQSTTLYVFDSTHTNAVYIQNPPSDGTLDFVGRIIPTYAYSAMHGFDIQTVNNNPIGYMALQAAQDDGVSVLHRINLTPELEFFIVPQRLGIIAGGELIDGLAVTGNIVPEPTALVLAATTIGAVIAIRRQSA